MAAKKMRKVVLVKDAWTRVSAPDDETVAVWLPPQHDGRYNDIVYLHATDEPVASLAPTVDNPSMILSSDEYHTLESIEVDDEFILYGLWVGRTYSDPNDMFVNVL